MIAECLEKRIDEIITLPEALRRTGIIENAPVTDIPPCSMPRPELDFLYKMVRRFGGSVFEAGSYAGGSTRAIHHALDHNGGDAKVYAVDLFHRFNSKRSWPRRVEIVGNSRTYSPPEVCALGFEDADHTRFTTRQNLEQMKEAGCKVLIVHDVDAEKLLDAPMAMEHTSRAGALEFFAENPEYRLTEVLCIQGLFVGLKRSLKF